MKKTSVVIDDFFDNPDEIRNIAIECLKLCTDNLINDPRDNYPGVRTNHLGVIQPELHVELKHKVQEIWGAKFPTFSSYFHATTEIHKLGLCHSDPNDVAGVIYLNPTAPPNSGTQLVDAWNGNDFRFTFEEDRNFHNACKTHDIAEIENYAKMKEKINSAYFKTSINVENRYNRLIMYDAKHFHGPGKYFGHNLNTSRLSLVFFGFYKYLGR